MYLNSQNRFFILSESSLRTRFAQRQRVIQTLQKEALALKTKVDWQDRIADGGWRAVDSVRRLPQAVSDFLQMEEAIAFAGDCDGTVEAVLLEVEFDWVEPTRRDALCPHIRRQDRRLRFELFGGHESKRVDFWMIIPFFIWRSVQSPVRVGVATEESLQ